MELLIENYFYICLRIRRDAGVAELARLESVYTPKGYPGFESPSLRVDDTLKRIRKKQQ